jgi:hypothetical protein
MSTTEVALLAALIGFAGGSLMATIIGAFVTHLIFHPVISVRLDKRKGSYGDVPIDFTFTDEAGKERKERMPAKFLRLHVENTGRSSIKACSGYIRQASEASRGG